MTELEALARECIENHTHKLIARPTKQDIYTREESIYISGYKECERQNKNHIAELEKRLETAKKILKGLVAGVVLYSDDDFKAAKAAAEEFLKEDE